METPLKIAVFALLVVVVGCAPVPINAPPGLQYPGAGPQPPAPPQITSGQRWQHAWNKALEGVALGGYVGGPYGAGGGLIIGLITGLLTADSHYLDLNQQVSVEQQKDQHLEAAIEKELERQRALENQVAIAANAASTETRIEPAQRSPESPPGAAQPNPNPGRENTRLASLGKPTVPAPVQPANPFKNVEVKDINGDGVPDLWIYYNPHKPAEIIRQEEASKADGTVDTWSYFKDGKLVRREVDSKAHGRPDTIFYYAGDKIAREERDETGQGRMTYRALFEDGRLAKTERDTADRGRPDLWTYYDTANEGERIIREERDLNGDGVADLWTYFENGRVARRDVSAAGLDVLARQDKIVLPKADVQPIALTEPIK